MSKLIGTKYEEIALAFLIKQNLIKLRQNYQTRYGEIDLIMLEGDKIIFVEVRKRKTIDEALESITPHKTLKIMLAASEFLCTEIKTELDPRFDAVCIDNNGKIEWIRDIIVG